MKNSMADDFDDGNMGKEDSAYVTQFENVINDIKSQLHTTNPAELARLNSAISSLLASNLPTKILKSLEALQAAVAKEEQRAEQNITYSQEEKSREALELQKQIEFLEKEAERLEAERSAQFHQESIKLKEQHTEFNKNADAYLTARKSDTSELHDVVKDLKDGKDVESKLQKLVKSEDQIKKQNTEYKNLLEHRDKVHEHYDGVMKHDKKLKEEKVELEKARVEKEKSKDVQSISEIETIEQKIKHQNKKITDFAPVVEQTQKQKDEVDAKIQKIEDRKDFVKEMGDLDELIKQLQQTDPDKHKQLKNLSTLIKNQEDAIVKDGVVNDTLLRSEFTDKTKNAENLEPEIAGTNSPSFTSKQLTEVASDKTPQDSKTIDQEQDKTPTIDLNKTLKDQSHKLGDKIIQKLGYDDQVAVMNQLSEKHLNQHITEGLSETKAAPLKPVPTPNPKFTTLHKNDKQR